MLRLYFNAKIYGPVTNIYAVDEDGKIQRVTHNTSWKDIEHDVATDNSVVFSSNRTPKQKVDLRKTREVYDLYFFDAQTEKVQKLTDTTEREYLPKFDPSGKKIAYLKITRSNSTELRLMDRNAGKDRVIATAENIFDFSWSPSGEEIAFSVGGARRIGIDKVELKTNVRSGLIESPIENNHQVFLTAPTWSPNGQQLAYVTHPSNRNEQKALYLIDLKSKEGLKLSEEGMQVQSPISWSADSKNILYAALVDYDFYYDERLRDKVYEGSMQVFLSDTLGKNRQLTQGKHFHGKPVFSKNESQIAYLFSEKLGGAYSYSVRVLDLERGTNEELFASVQRESSLLWR